MLLDSRIDRTVEQAGLRLAIRSHVTSSTAVVTLLLELYSCSRERKHERPRAFSAQIAYNLAAVTMQKTALLIKYFGLFQLGDVPPVGMSRKT